MWLWYCKWSSVLVSRPENSWVLGCFVRWSQKSDDSVCEYSLSISHFAGSYSRCGIDPHSREESVLAEKTFLSFFIPVVAIARKRFLRLGVSRAFISLASLLQWPYYWKCSRGTNLNQNTTYSGWKLQWPKSREQHHLHSSRFARSAQGHVMELHTLAMDITKVLVSL